MKFKNIINGIVWAWAFGSFSFFLVDLVFKKDLINLTEFFIFSVLVGVAGFGYITLFNITKYSIIKYREWKKN